MTSLLERLGRRRIGADPDDDEETRKRKALNRGCDQDRSSRWRLSRRLMPGNPPPNRGVLRLAHCKLSNSDHRRTAADWRCVCGQVRLSASSTAGFGNNWRPGAAAI
ncbi:MAG: hypothetical protein ABJC24_05850 [Chloroflexota bacterium]